MWEGVNCFLDIMLSCSNGMLQWYWGLWLIGTVSLKVTPPWEIWNKWIHLKSGSVNFLMAFFFNCYSQRERREMILYLFFSCLKYCENSQVLCFNLSCFERAWGPDTGRGVQPLPISSLHAYLPPLPHLTELYLQLRHPSAGAHAEMPRWTRALWCCLRSCGDLLKDIVFKNSPSSAFWWI